MDRWTVEQKLKQSARALKSGFPAVGRAAKKKKSTERLFVHEALANALAGLKAA